MGKTNCFSPFTIAITREDSGTLTSNDRLSGVRVRFAPSPTGHLHLGGARTALFNFLFARHHGGTMVLRIEDTDRERSTESSIAAILDGMDWLGLSWDEGPFYQTHRLERYREVALSLLKSGDAYRCRCTPEELEERRATALKLGLPPGYDGRCRDLAFPEHLPHVVRFRSPRSGTVAFDDLIRGHLAFDSAILDDLILLRTDGMPTYNFAVVIDDIDMRITHVIRGDDHINNTPRQIPIFRALGAPLPSFVHLPMIYGPDRTRLSKRHGATSVMAYKEMGYLPHALVNYLVRLGWSHKDQEVFSRNELIEFFDLDHVGSAPSVFNPEKLLWLNALYIKNSEPETLVPFLKESLSSIENPLATTRIDAFWPRLADLLKTRARTLTELASSAAPFLGDPVVFDPEATKKFLVPENLPILLEITERLRSLDEWSHDFLKIRFDQAGETLHKKLGELAGPVRVSLVGRSVSPGIFDVLELLGPHISLERLNQSIARIQRHTPTPMGVPVD